MSSIQQNTVGLGSCRSPGITMVDLNQRAGELDQSTEDTEDHPTRKTENKNKPRDAANQTFPFSILQSYYVLYWSSCINMSFDVYTVTPSANKWK